MIVAAGSGGREAATVPLRRHAPSPLAPLARLDLRLLLPSPPAGDRWQRLAVLGGPNGLATALVAAGVAATVVDSVPPAGAADAVALLAGGRRPLRDVARALVPGGALALEWNGGLRGLRAALATAPGLRLVGAWAPWPDPLRWQACLPLASRAAVAWFGRTLYPAWTMRKRWLRRRLLAGRTTAARTLIAIAVREPAAAGDPGLLAAPGIAPLAPPGTAPLLLRHGAERVTALLFPPGATLPTAALKVPRTPDATAGVAREQAVLAAVRDRLAPAQAEAVPVPGGVVPWAGVGVAIESCPRGETLVRPGARRGARRRRALDDLAVAAAWVAELGAQTAIARPALGPPTIARWLEPPLAACEAARRPTREEAALYAATRARAAALAPLPLPIVWRHRDFTPWNLLREDGRLGVLDWEGGEPGPALCDLLHFLGHWWELANGATSPGARLRAFAAWLRPAADDALAAAARAAIDRACERVGLDPALVPVLHVVTRAEIAARPGAGDMDRAYVRALAAARETLFTRFPGSPS